nr:hypothetical protein [uncultured Pseudomonas sp.]
MDDWRRGGKALTILPEVSVGNALKGNGRQFAQNNRQEQGRQYIEQERILAGFRVHDCTSLLFYAKAVCNL